MPASIKGWLLLTGAAMIGLLIFATAYQYRIDWKARGWTRTQGRIRSSRMVSRKVRSGVKDGNEIRNFAEVTYDYAVGDETLRGNRVHLGADLGNFEVAETVARYPRGADVVVYFNPEKPNEAVLERDPPEGIYRTLVIVILCCIGLWLAFAFGAEPLLEAVAARVPKPGNFWAVGLFGGFGAFFALMALALKRELDATRNWRSTWGRIERAEVDTFKAMSAGRDRRWITLHAPLITYSYTVGGQRFSSSRTHFGGRMSLSRDFWARRRIAKYESGTPVMVYYDPDTPTSAVLQRRSAGLGALWIAAIVLLALAARAAGYI